jgi:hypothetical protein
MRIRRWLLTAPLLALSVCVGSIAIASSAFGDHATRPHTKNMHAQGHSPHPATFLGAFSEDRNINSDIAFRGKLVFNGNYDGFRIIKGSPGKPKEINWTHCNGDQGDIFVWDDILVRTWNSPAPADNPATPTRNEARRCDGQPVPQGFEGLHIFDISNLNDPQLIGDVELSNRPQSDAEPFGCGSHTITGVPDRANNRLILYNETSVPPAAPAGAPPFPHCPWVSIIEVPLDDPANASWLRNEPLEGLEADHDPHDSGAILGDVNLLAVAAHDHANVFDIGANDHPGGSLQDPEFLYTIQEPGVCSVPDDPMNPNPQRLCNGAWHSASFSWDGEVIILGWEPGGGVQPECEAGDLPVKKSAFFYDADTGAKLGQWTLPRPQSAMENCTIHNYNTVPTRSGRDILVSGNYQAGTWVTEFTDPANPVTLGWSDLPWIGQVTLPGTTTLVNEVGGAWSSYWYNGNIYESEITKGLNVFRFSHKATAGAIRLDHLNPQTQEFSLP